EMYREANTISAKGSDLSLSQIVVELKSELEKLREQVQNVE
ncbi:MAG: endoribonuclease YicC domain-containing protein, partial [Nitrospinota bacterium]